MSEAGPNDLMNIMLVDLRRPAWSVRNYDPISFATILGASALLYFIIMVSIHEYNNFSPNYDPAIISAVVAGLIFAYVEGLDTRNFAKVAKPVFSFRNFNSITLPMVFATVSIVYVLILYITNEAKPIGSFTFDDQPATWTAIAAGFIFLLCVGLGTSSASTLAILAGFVGLGGLVTVALGINYDENEQPNVNVPAAVNRATLSGIAWTARNPRLRRHHMECRLSNCMRGQSAYVVETPDDQKILYLNTQRHMRTGYANSYPVATVLVVPARSSSVEYIIDYNGIRPLINADNSLLNMGSTWATSLSTVTDGLNVTGNYKHSFVIFNESNRVVYFAREALTSQNTTMLDYWSLLPGSKTLMWPDSTYHNNSNIIKWNASPLPTDMHYDVAASIAESLMFDVLAPQNPTA